MDRRFAVTPDEVVDLPQLWAGDVLVVGGGSAGGAAAVAAGRAGARVLLVESGGFLGGTGTRVLDTFYGFFAADWRVVGGIGWEICETLLGRDLAFCRPNTYGAGTGVTYDPEALKVVWDELTAAAGARVLLYGLVTRAVLDGGRILGVVVETRAGPYRLSGSVVVDATGDGDVAWRAGATTDSPAAAGLVQPGTATFRLAGVTEDAASTAELHRLLAQAADVGGYQLPRREGSIHKTLHPGERHTNLTRVAGRDLTDPWELTWAEQEGRRQAWEYARFLRDRVPGYQESHLVSTATRLGIRESRRLVGRYVLSRTDFQQAAAHPDDIALCGAPLEDHAHGGRTRWEYVGGADHPDGRTYGIPLRSLLPLEVGALIVAGRCFSATHEAHASARSIGQCLAMGQAAGTAAALAASTHLDVAEVDPGEVRARLRQAGAILEFGQVVAA